MMPHTFRSLLGRFLPISSRKEKPTTAASHGNRTRVSLEQLESRMLMSATHGPDWRSMLRDIRHQDAAPLAHVQVPGLDAYLHQNADAVLVPQVGTQASKPLRLQLLGSNQRPGALRFGTPDANDPKGAGVLYRNVYRGIDAIYRETENDRFQYLFVVHPSANSKQIELAYRGAKQLRLDEQGNLHFLLGAQPLMQQAPIAFQIKRGERQEVRVEPWLDRQGHLHFRLGSYDPRRPVIIDPEFNYPPTAMGDSYSVTHDQTLNVAANGVLSNDYDPDGNPLSASLVTGPSHGTLTLNSDGSFSYVPDAAYAGSDSFTYKAFDGIAYSNMPATVNINVVNYPITAQNDSYSVTHDQMLNVDAMSGVLSNDYDPDGDPKTATLVTGVNHGTLTLNSDGSFVYEPEAGYAGNDSFTYKAFDGVVYSYTATANISVTNYAPTGSGDSYDTPHDQLLMVDAIDGVLANDYDPDGDDLYAVLATEPLHGVLTFNSDGSFEYIPDPGYVGTDSFGYNATDGIGYAAASTVTINVTNNMLPPGGTNISVSDVEVTEGHSGTISAVFWVTLSQVESSQVTVSYATADGTARSEDEDYASLSGMLTFEPGVTSLSVPVSVNGDIWIENDENFYLYLSSPSGASIQDGIGKATILDDEPVVTLLATDIDAAEEGADSGAFTVTRTGGTSTDLVVYYEIAGSAQNGADYTSLTGSATIYAGQSSAQIVIAPSDDTSPEGVETVHLFLLTGPGYDIGAAANDLVWISEADGPAAGPNVDLVAFRPQTPIFRRTPVPASTEDTVGAGIRSNGDNDDGDALADWSDSNVEGENDLIEISLDFGLQQVPQGIEYYLARNNSNVKVWDSSTKGGAVLDGNDQQQIPFSPGLSLWVEWTNPTFSTATSILTFGARDALTKVDLGTTDSVIFFRFTSVVAIIGGRLQAPTDPPNRNQGVFVIGSELYASQAYDVHMFAEGAQVPGGQNRGTGHAYNEVVNALNHRRVTYVSVFGYSWGGGATYNLVDRLVADAAVGQINGPFAFPFTGYIDAVVHGVLGFGAPETRRPPSSQFHANYYERIGTPDAPLNVMGNAVPGSDYELNVNTTQWGGNLDHYLIDDDSGGEANELLGLAGRNVLAGLRDRFLTQVNR